MDYNIAPISVREGFITIDGVRVYDGVNFTLNFTPDVWTGKQLGQRTDSSRWLGYKITGTITRRRATNWIESVISKYMKDGVTPEFKIQGVMTDKGSEYFKANGDKSITAVGCVLSGDISLIKLDSAGDVLEDSLSFNATDIL